MNTLVALISCPVVIKNVVNLSAKREVTTFGDAADSGPPAQVTLIPATSLFMLNCPCAETQPCQGLSGIILSHGCAVKDIENSLYCYASSHKTMAYSNKYCDDRQEI